MSGGYIYPDVMGVAGPGMHVRYHSGGGPGQLQPLPPPPPPMVTPPAKPPPVEQSFTNWGKVIPISMGMRRMSPMIIWLKAPVFIGVTVKADFAVSWGYNADDNPGDTECTALYANGTRIWTIERGKLLPGNWSWKWYPGTESQGQDATMVADKGAANTPAYRNQMYGVFKDFPLEKFGFKLPGISAEITGSGSEAPRTDSWNPADKQANVVLDTPYTISKFVPSGWTGDIGDPNIGLSMSASGVRSRTFHRRGQYYFEVRADYLWRDAWYGFGGYIGVGAGIATAAAPLAYPAGYGPGNAGTGVPFPDQGLANSGPPTHRTSTHGLVGYSVPGPPLWNSGETYALHINMTAGYIRARNVSADSAWTAPLYYTREAHPDDPNLEISLGDALYAYANLHFGPTIYAVTLSDRQTVNFGASPFLGTIPSGATAWNGTGGTETFFGTLPLRDFISKIAIYTGLDPNVDLEFISINDVIHGGIITQDTEFSTFLSVLGRAYGFDFYEGDTIRIVKRVVLANYTIDKVIPPEDLLTDTDRAITTTRRKDDSPAEIELNYIDVTQQFRWNLQKARRILFPVRTTESQRKDTFSIPIVTTAKDALTMASKAMYREAEQNVDHEMKLTSKHFGLEPSDIVTITVADTEYTVKVAQVNIEEDMRITLSVVNLQTDEDMEFDAEAGEPSLPYQPIATYMVAEEPADVAAFSQLVSNLWAMEGADTFAGAAVVLTLAATDRPDTFAGSGVSAGATMAAVDRPDVFTGLIDFLTLDLDFTTMG